MSLSDHTYLKSAFGTGQYDYTTFQRGLDVSSFSSQIRGILNGPTSVTITIESITGGQQTELDDLVTNHTPDTSKARIQNFVIFPKRNSIKTTKYTLAHAFEYLGSDAIGVIDYIDLMAYVDSTSNTYDVRIVNSENGQILVENTDLSNNSLEVIDLGTISNIPTAKTTLELQVKRNGSSGNKTIELEQLIIYYGN